MTLSAAVVGATGYSGAELTALLARHGGVRLCALYSGPGGAGAPFSGLHPSLSRSTGPDVEPFRAEALLERAPDFVFLATPSEASAQLAPSLLAAGIRVIDLSGAFRLGSAEEYARWYGAAHPAPDLLAEAVYGLTEWCNGELAGARLVANPGCYPTSILIALLPLAGLLDPAEAIICDAKSGVSGAGKSRDPAHSFAELSGNFKAYGVGRHRHEPEIRQQLGIGAGAPFVFVPHLLPAVRGILSTIHVAFARPVEARELAEAYGVYAGRAFVHVRPEGQLPELRDVVGTPRAEVGFVLLDGGKRAVIVSVLDNLLKGAASQAVQNLNRAAGFAETEGLS